MGQELSGHFPLSHEVAISADGNKSAVKDCEHRQDNGGWKHGVTQCRCDKAAKDWMWSWGMMGWDSNNFVHAVSSEGGADASVVGTCGNEAYGLSDCDTLTCGRTRRASVASGCLAEALAISSDGLQLAASWIMNVHVYQYDCTWKQIGSLWTSENVGTSPTAVAMSSDGKIVTMGLLSENQPGCVVVKQCQSSGDNSSGSWRDLGQSLMSKCNGDVFGRFVALSAFQDGGKGD